MTSSHQTKSLVGRFFIFMVKVAYDFRRNQGFLLSGAVAFYTLLSVVPVSILALTILSNFIGEDQLIQTMSAYLDMVIPGYAATLTEQIRAFVQNRHVIGVIGFIVMLFFSSIAFTVLENAMSVIFYHHVLKERRRFIISALIPFMYIFALTLGILLVSLIVGAAETLESRGVSYAGTPRIVLSILGIAGEILMLTSIYLVMPVVRISMSHALVGGITATVLWEIVRRVLLWYYTSLSMVNIIYGSITTIVVTLLCIEASALIILFGAQVIAELEQPLEVQLTEEPPGFET
jgi:membrane protein